MDLSELNEIGSKVNSWQKEETRYFKSLPLKNYIFAAIAFLGLCTTLLPWGDVIVGFYAQAVAVGLHFFKGWLIFLVFGYIIAILLFNKYLKLKENLTAIVPILGAGAAVVLSLGFIVWHLFKVQYGAYLCLGISIILFLTVLMFDKLVPKR